MTLAEALFTMVNELVFAEAAAYCGWATNLIARPSTGTAKDLFDRAGSILKGPS